MLILHQVGSVKIGEVVRYTVTYTPSQDRILPSPECLYLRVKNSSAIALRAAFVNGPYNLYAAAWPATFNPHEKFEDARRYGVPEFEPMLKAGGTWTCPLVVPEDIRQTAGNGPSRQHFGNGPEHDTESVTWIIEVSSQIILSASAAVHYEVLLARDEKSLSLSSGIPVIGNQAQTSQPGRLSDFQQSKGAKDGRHAAQARGIFSKAIHLTVEDTASLWNTPQLPGLEQSARHTEASKDIGAQAVQPATSPRDSHDQFSMKSSKKKDVHLVIITHGLYSNLGADMLFLKESIDAGAKQAKIDARARRNKEKTSRTADLTRAGEGEPPKEAGMQDSHLDVPNDEDEDEEVVVRGFSGNAARTERGIKYLGKRLAKYVLSITYPDQPFLPPGKAAQDVFTQAFRGHHHSDVKDAPGDPSHKHSNTHQDTVDSASRGFKIAKISFIAHSLGGLIQTYAIAYIQKHSPQFFNLIKPINFIAMASPLLGISHENPMYVKFALDFGVVGRTGQDLGLTWRAPTIARNGWGAIVGNMGENAHKKVMGEPQPESKPLLRILPTGPAHIALKKFRNRTVYSNIVNDGIVPLRTSCLLFLDWQGLERVEKARREAGLVETIVGFGWAELTGANVTAQRKLPWTPQEGSQSDSQGSGDGTSVNGPDSHEVPQPPSDAVLEDNRRSLATMTTPYREEDKEHSESTSTTTNNNPLSGLFGYFKNTNDTANAPPRTSAKTKKIYQRSQTLPLEGTGSESSQSSKVTSGHGTSEEPHPGVLAPPKTSIFESAGDVLNPKLPSVEYIIDPSQRPRTIFHDRVYHPQDIPMPPLKKRSVGPLPVCRKSVKRTGSSDSLRHTDSGSSSPYPPPPSHQGSMASAKDYDDTEHTNPDKDAGDVIDSANMRVEEKIARAYHRDLSWRKVLVKMEPDAHNNMICRRMFANAFGWPVVKHMVDTHFSDAAVARLRDEDESNAERAKAVNQSPDEQGNETKDRTRSIPMAAQSDGDGHVAVPIQTAGIPEHRRTRTEIYETKDGVPFLPAISFYGEPLSVMLARQDSSFRSLWDRQDSWEWSERDFSDSGVDSGTDERPSLDSQKGQGRASTSSERASSGYWTEKIVGKGAMKNQSRSRRQKERHSETATGL